MSATLRFELRPRAKEDGTHAIILRLTMSRQVARISTGVFTSARFWNKKANDQLENWIKKEADDYLILKTGLRNKLRRAQAALVRMEATPGDFTFEKVKKEVARAVESEPKEEPKPDAPPKMDLIAFWEKQVKLFEQKKSESYAGRFRSELNDMKSFAKKKSVPFDSINIDFLHKFEIYCLKERGCSRNTVNKKLQRFHKILTAAIQQGYATLANDPFPLLELTWEKTNRQKLTPEQIEKLESLDLSGNEYLKDARNIFLAQYYLAGMRISDALCLRWQNVQDDRLRYIMGKTKTGKNIKITPVVMAILDQYRKPKQRATDFIFPYLENGLDPEQIEIHKKKLLDPKTAMVNRRLKTIAEMAEIDLPISTHIARHSFADNTNKATGNVYAVSKALGHTSIKVTETYLAEMDDGAVDDTLDQMFGSINPTTKTG